MEGVDLYIEKGQIYGLVGRNGAGKTTIIRMLTAQTLPTEGEMELFGETDEKGISAARARRGHGGDPQLYPYLTARQNLEYYRRQRGIPRGGLVDRALEQVGPRARGKKKFKQFLPGDEAAAGAGAGPDEPSGSPAAGRAINGLDPEGIVEFRTSCWSSTSSGRPPSSSQAISSPSCPISPRITASSTRENVGAGLGRRLERKVPGLPSAHGRRRLPAALVLEQRLGTRDYEVLPGNILRLYHFLDRPRM